MPNIIVTIINGVFPPLYLDSKTKHGISTSNLVRFLYPWWPSPPTPPTSIRLARKACESVTKALLHQPDGHSDAWISVHLPLKSCRYGQGRDSDWAPGSRISSPSDFDTKGHTCPDWSIRRADRSPGYMWPYKELGNELDKNYAYERILSTSRGSSGSSGSMREVREFINVALAREEGLPRMTERSFFFFLPCILGGFFFFSCT